MTVRFWADHQGAYFSWLVPVFGLCLASPKAESKEVRGAWVYSYDTKLTEPEIGEFGCAAGNVFSIKTEWVLETNLKERR